MGEVMLFFLQLFFLRLPLAEFMAFLRGLDGLTLAYLAFTNVFVLGQDLLWFVSIDSAHGLAF